MKQRPLTLINGDEVLSLLRTREKAVMNAVRSAYRLHGERASSLPHSSFLTFPDRERERIIALPAFLGGEAPVAGMKWIASFPDNVKKGEERASALLVLNDMESGFPFAVIESSTISAMRTAASAAVAVECIWDAASGVVGIVGCGRINHEIVRFLKAGSFGVKSLIVFDRDSMRAEQFGDRIKDHLDGAEVYIAGSLDDVLSGASVVSFATTAVKPHLFKLPSRSRRQLILHVSLRDLGPEVILNATNIVDDEDHVTRANTSVHLAEQKVGHREFIAGELHQWLSGKRTKRELAERITIFSPFGLGVLDLAVGKLVSDLAGEIGLGERLDSFFPQPWTVPVDGGDSK
jgi:N-[(2S)-2-amino-2-carboxyethyl]-L-glutamate dehydrogenase